MSSTHQINNVETKHRSYSHPVGFGGPIYLIHIEIDRKLFKKCLLWWHFPPGVGIPGLNWNPDPGIWENIKKNEFKSFDPIKFWKIGMEMLGFNQVPGFCFWHLHVVPVYPLSLREDINRKKTFSFGHCPNVGGGGLNPCPDGLGHFF